MLIAEAKEKDLLAPVTVIVPSQYAGISLRHVLSLQKGLINVRFMVISRLAEYLGSPSLNAKGKLPLSPLFELAAIQHVADRMSGQKPLGDVNKHPQLHQSLLRAFREFDKISYQDLQRLAAFDPLRKQTVGWYSEVKKLTANYYTCEDLTREAARSQAQNEAAGTLVDLGLIIFYLTSELSPAEIELVSGLCNLGKAAVIFGFTGEPEVDNQIKRLIYKFNPDFQISSKGINLQHMIEQAVIAHDYREEVKWIVRHLLKKAEDGIPFYRMAVLYRDTFPYAESITQQLRAADIPAAGPATSTLKDTPPGKFLVHLLQLIRDDFARDRVMHWIAESPVKAVLEDTPAQAELARWEIITQKAGIIKGAEQWRNRLKAYRNNLQVRVGNPDVFGEMSPSEAKGLQEELISVELLDKFINRLLAISIPADGASYCNFAKWILELIDNFVWNPAGWPNAGQELLERVKELVNEIGNLDGLIPGGTTLDGFSALVENALESLAGRTGVTGEGVFVAPVATAEGMDFEAVYIAGMSEGSFPSRRAIDPLLPDSVRMVVPGSILPLSTERKIGQRRQYLAVLAAAKTGIVSFSQTDAGAERGQYASPWFLEELGRLKGEPLTASEIENPESKPWLSVVYSSEQALKYAESLTPLDSQDYDMASLARWSKKGWPAKLHFLLTETTPAGKAVKMEKTRRSAEFSIWDGNLTSLAGKSRRLGLPDKTHFSPTRLEKWAGCPMSYFWGHILQIPVYEKPEEIITIEAKDRGSLIHEILERFMQTLLRAGALPDYGQPWNSQQESLLIQIAREEFSRAESQGITGHPLMWAMAREEIERDLITFLDKDSEIRAAHQMKPVRFEQSFGVNTRGLPAVNLQINGKKISLHGYIDRVDSNRSGDQLMVIDYKTGGVSSYNGMRKNPLDCGRKLQLPVYGIAVRQSLGTATSITAAYWFISTKGNFERREVVLSEVEDKFMETVDLIASGIEKGLFPANPGNNGNDNCLFCDFERICNADRDLLWERKSQAPELELYLKLINDGPKSEEAE